MPWYRIMPEIYVTSASSQFATLSSAARAVLAGRYNTLLQHPVDFGGVNILWKDVEHLL